MEKYINKMLDKNIYDNLEQRTCKEIVVAIAMKYGASIMPVSFEGNNMLLIRHDKFDLVMTVCETDKHRVIKLEDLVIGKEEDQWLEKELLNFMKKICDKNKCILGLWSEINDLKKYDYYKKLGFSHVDTRNDFWFEYGGGK